MVTHTAINPALSGPWVSEPVWRPCGLRCSTSFPPLGSSQDVAAELYSENGTEGLRVQDHSPARGALRSPERLRRALATGRGHGVCSTDRRGWDYRPTGARSCGSGAGEGQQDYGFGRGPALLQPASAPAQSALLGGV